LNRHFAGLTPWPYHAVNVALHIANSVLVFWLVGFFTRRRLLPLAAAVLFAVHPIHTEAVAWISGRAELMGMLFLLIAWGMFLQADRAKRWSRVVWWVGSALAFLCGLLCKENVLMLPVVLVVSALCLRRLRFNRRSRVRLGWGLWFVRLVALMTPYAMALSAYFHYRGILYGEALLRNRVAISESNNPLVSLEFLSRITTGISLLGAYLGQALIGFPMSADYSYNQYPIVQSYGDVRLICSCLALAFCVGLSLVSWQRRGMLWLWFVYFVVMLAPVVNILTVIGTIRADRFVYAPSLAACAFYAIWLQRLRVMKPKRAKRKFDPAVMEIERKKLKGVEQAIGAQDLQRVAFGSLIVVFVTLTWHRNGVWSSNATLWKQTARESPRSAAAQYNRGVYEISQGHEREALEAWKRALEIDPGHASARLNEGTIQLARENYDRAENSFRSGLEFDPANAPLNLNLGVLLAGKGEMEEAKRLFAVAVQSAPQNPVAHYNLGLASATLGDDTGARRSYARALLLKPDYAEALNGLAAVEIRAGNTERATKLVRDALLLKPELDAALKNKAYLDAQRAKASETNSPAQ
jgi:tetratricopeptide (TPR) repeat protein